MTEDNQNMQDASSCLSREVIVANDNGLHARPAGKLAQAAQAFEAEIFLVMDDQEVDAKSILDVLTLAAGPGDRLDIRAAGDDAEEALDALETMFQRRFDE